MLPPPSLASHWTAFLVIVGFITRRVRWLAKALFTLHLKHWMWITHYSSTKKIINHVHWQVYALPLFLTRISGRSFKHGDRHVGAVVGNGQWFVTSPNMEFIPQPALGCTRNICICADFRYGEDNLLQWPQPYFALDCHLDAIPLCPGPDNTMSIMWWQPEPKDFVPTTATTIGRLGLIDRKHFTYLSYMVSSLCSRTEEFMLVEPSGQKNEVIPSFMTVVRQGMKWLENLPMGRCQVFMNVWYVQRCYLEEVFTVPLVFRTDSAWTARTVWTVCRLYTDWTWNFSGRASCQF